ncbi:hypothetical protein GF356_09715 [candidate division GN15 bacterium]|nr:hypothetical protein [candidate division GN15 bacterium]
MSGDVRKVLDMLAAGKITVDDAEKLLEALHQSGSPSEADSAELSSGGQKKAKFLCVHVDPKDGRSHGRHEGKVRVKIPLMLIKAGVKLGKFLPEGTRDQVNAKLSNHGLDINVSDLDSSDLNAFIESLQTSSIDVEDDKETVRVFCC